MTDSPLNQRYVAGIVIPAHNEERTIVRLLRALQPSTSPPDFQIVVVCNGCTDQTAAEARRAAPGATVLETEIPSKREALKIGDRAIHTFPRIFIDADVEISRVDIMRLIRPLVVEGRLASSPRRQVSMDGVGYFVRSYYEVWERLPQVRAGLFGRGVIALTQEGNDRVQRLPQVMSDDLVMSEAFTSVERVVVEDAVVTVHPPRRLRDLIRRRIRVATGNSEADTAGLRSESSKTSLRSLWRIIANEPAMTIRMPVFLGVTIASRLFARRAVKSGDFTTWQRDESSRT